MGSHLLSSLYSATQAARLRRLTGSLPPSIRKYSQGKKDGNSGHGTEERAPSTAEEFQRVAEEKSRQGIVPSSAETAQDAAVEDIVRESDFASVEEEPPKKGNFRNTGNDKQ